MTFLAEIALSAKQTLEASPENSEMAENATCSAPHSCGRAFNAVVSRAKYGGVVLIARDSHLGSVFLCVKGGRGDKR